MAIGNAMFTNLTGHWIGIYHYVETAGIEPTPFNAVMEDQAGKLVGEIDEPNTYADPAAARLYADLFGVRQGLEVRFVKSMNGTGGACHDIVYEGQCSADFGRIDGRWTIPGHWSGAFEMVRIDGAMAQAQDRVAAAVATSRS